MGWRFVRPGFHVNDAIGLELHRGLDDSDGYPVVEWQIWTCGMGEALGVRPTLSAAKQRAADLARQRAGR